MLVGVLGVNHKSSCLTLREKLAAVRPELSLPFPAAILSTCNRFEIYYSANVLAEAHVELINRLRSEIDLTFEHHLYSYFGLDCFSHLISVTAGLDSALVGETEIQSQVKRMYATYKNRLNTPLHYLIQKSLKMAKGIRNAHYYPQAESSLGKCIAEKLICNRALFIGNSAINRTVWSYLRRQGIEVHVASRSPVPDVKQVPLETWPEYTAIIAATHSVGYLIDAVPDRKERQLFDLSIPRVIDPQLRNQPGVSLYNLDELTKTEAPRPLEDCKEVIERLADRQIALYQKNRSVASLAK